jgi:hypothetical protein
VNIAFQALALLALVLPGILFHKGYSQIGRLRIQRPIVEEISRSLVFAVLFHAVWLGLSHMISHWTGVVADLRSVLILTMGEFGKDDSLLPTAVDSIVKFPGSVLAYLMTLYLASFWTGAWLSQLNERQVLAPWVRSALRFLDHDETNAERLQEWLENLQFDFESAEGDEVDLIPLFATIVDVGHASYLYAGVLQEIVPDNEGNPDRFVLRGTQRRPLSDDSAKLYDIKGDVFIIRASEARTINVQFVAVERPPQLLSSAPLTTAPMPAVYPDVDWPEDPGSGFPNHDC